MGSQLVLSPCQVINLPCRITIGGYVDVDLVVYG